jgi:PAS domain S-box-containing protein
MLERPRTARQARLADLDAVLDSLPVPAALARDPAAHDIRVNAAFARLVGVAPEAYVPLTRGAGPLPYAFLREGRELTAAEMPFARALGGLSVIAERIDVRSVDGTVHHMVFTAEPVVEDGRIAGAIAILADVGEQVHTARLLREITRLTPTLIFTTDPKGSIDFVNPRWNAIIGGDEQALIGMGWRAYIHPADLPAIDEKWAAHRHSGDPYASQWRIRRRDGTYRWVEIHAEAERDATGRLVRWFCAGVDVDTQRRAIDALEFLAQGGATIAGHRDVDTMLQILAETALEGLADITFFDLLAADGSSRRLVVATPGIPEDALAAVSAYSTPPRDDAHPIARAVHAFESVLVAIVDEAYLEAHVSDPQRRAAWRLVQIRSLMTAPLRSGDDSFGAITMLRTRDAVPFSPGDLHVIEEIGRRVALALDNMRLAEAARSQADERERELRLIADSIAQLMWTAGPDGSLDWYNRRWYEYTGQTPAEALGWGWQAVHHPADLPAVMEKWPQAVASGEKFEMEFRLRRSDGTFRWFLTQAMPLRDAAGRIIRWYGTNTDIDDARRSARNVGVFADVGERVAGSLTLTETLDNVLQSLLPSFADWGLITFADERGDLRVAAAFHPDARLNGHLATLTGTVYARSEAEVGTAQAMRQSEPLLFHPTYETALRGLRRDALEIIWPLGCASILAIPFGPETALRGSITLAMSDERREFDPLDIPFFSEFARRVAPRIANAQVYERERRVARTFQEAALPTTLPRSEGFAFHAIYEAGRAEALIGGDWYDAFRLIDGRIVVSIGDVAGSGLHSAVTMASVRQAIRGVAQVHADPDLMLEAADRALRAEAPERFVTAFVGVIDPLTATMTYRSAGHPPPILRRTDGTLAYLDLPGLPLGLHEREETETPTIVLDEGSLLVLYTDGLIESTRDIREGERRVLAALADRDVLDARDPAKALHDAVLVDGSHDDVAILTIATHARTAAATWELDAADETRARAVRDAIVRDLREHQYPETLVTAAEMVFAELVGNLARYAPGMSEIIVEWETGRPVLHVRDRGPGFSFVPKLPQDIYSESGRGLFLVTALSEDFHVTRRAGGGSHARVVLRV